MNPIIKSVTGFANVRLAGWYATAFIWKRKQIIISDRPFAIEKIAQNLFIPIPLHNMLQYISMYISSLFWPQVEVSRSAPRFLQSSLNHRSTTSSSVSPKYPAVLNCNTKYSFQSSSKNPLRTLSGLT